MWLKTTIPIFKMFLNFFLILVAIALILLFPFICSCVFHFVYFVFIKK